VKKGCKPCLSAEIRKAIREWARFGTSTGDVARKLNVSPQTVRRYARDEVKAYWRATT
jgi:IS30 family transposase